MKKIISILLITIFISTFSFQANEVFAKDNQVYLESAQNNYVNGTYDVSNEVLKVDSDEISAARKYVDEKSVIEISDNDIEALINFNQRNLMTDITIKLNGKLIEYSSKEEGDANLKVIIPLEDLDNSIEVSAIINTGFFKMPVTFRVVFDTSSIPLKDLGDNEKEDNSVVDDDSVVGDDSNGNHESEGDSNISKPDNIVPNPENSIVTPPSVGTGYFVYKVQNEIITSSAIGYTAARSAISSSSYIERYDDQMYLTVGISMLDVMNNIRITVNGVKVSYEIIKQDNSKYTMDIRFKVNSINDNIKFTTYISAAQMDISFGLDLLEETMNLISRLEANDSLSSSSSSQELLESLNVQANDNNLNATEVVAEDILVEMKSYYKKYTIENEILSDSVIGKNMARKYIDKTCILDEIDGQYYLTIKVLNSNAMSNIKIEVNGEEVEYSIISKDNAGNIAVKLKINDISDSIKMYMTIMSVNKSVDFGIKLLEDTMVLIDEGTASQNNDENKDDVLENFMVQDSSENKSNKKLIMLSSASTMAAVFLIEGIIFAVLRKTKKKA